MSDNKRIQFIDLAKGLCIILVVLGHLVPVFNENLTFVFCFRMPLYFCLSGLFYKDYGGIKNLIVKKCNKIFVPFVAWYFISYAIYMLGRIITHSELETQYHVWDILITNDIYNIPIWFLLCLFWSNLLFAGIRIFAKSETYIGIGVLIVAGAGWSLSFADVFNFLYIGSAMSCLPFFYMGYALKKTNILCSSVSKNNDLLIMSFCLICACLIAFLSDEPPRLLYYKNKVSYGNALQIYTCAAMFVLGILLLCKMIGHIPFVSWLGRYSIIVLVIHMPQSAIFGTILESSIGQYVEPTTKYLINFTLVIASMTVVIPFCIRILPHITAQKDIFSDSTAQFFRKICFKHSKS